MGKLSLVYWTWLLSISKGQFKWISSGGPKGKFRTTLEEKISYYSKTAFTYFFHIQTSKNLESLPFTYKCWMVYEGLWYEVYSDQKMRFSHFDKFWF